MLRLMTMRIAAILLLSLATAACTENVRPATTSPQVAASVDAPATVPQPESENGCIGTVTAQTEDGQSVVLRRDGTVTLNVSPGAVVTIAGDGPCGDAVQVGGDSPEGGLRELSANRLVVERPGRYALRAAHAMCAGNPDPFCRGGVADDGSLLLTA